MKDTHAEFLDVEDLRIGHYVYIDLGWIRHPFPLSSFRITSRDQIDTIRELDIRQIRYSSKLSVFPEEESADQDEGSDEPAAPLLPSSVDPVVEKRREMLSRQRAQLQVCERQFGEAANGFRNMVNSVRSDPAGAGQACQAMVGGLVSDVLQSGESHIHLLSENAGERPSLHAVNVMVVSLLLAKACGLEEGAMRPLGMGALLHDIGKLELPDRIRFQDRFPSPTDRALYQEHVAKGVALGKRMNLPPEALLVIGQHHELADGSGFPQGLNKGQIARTSAIVGLVNRYDSLCNPGNPGLAVTPHEAMAQIFAQEKSGFDPLVLGIFVRMMGVYPPGSVVELSDNRFALVVSVNPGRPLRPRVIVHEPSIPADEALVLDLEFEPALGIRRSIRPLALPKMARDYLSPRQRVCYFFERALPLDE